MKQSGVWWRVRGDGGGEDASFSSFAGGGRGLRSEALGFKRGGAWDALHGSLME